jgi:DNA-3-methyladenine glycosylase
LTIKKDSGWDITAYDILDSEFYEGDTVRLARSLLGALMVHFSPAGLTSGYIVETEAYLCKDDPACHAARGKTKRNAAMFGPPGTAYVYFIYGNHYCFNIVSNREGVGEAVLIRALEPVHGLNLMWQRRGHKHKQTNLTNGPGKLCAAMAVNKNHNGLFLSGPPLFIARGKKISENSIGTSGRIGIRVAQDKPLRFFIKDNPFLSRLG